MDLTGIQQKDVVVKQEESFVKGYSSIKTFFQSKEFDKIYQANFKEWNKWVMGLALRWMFGREGYEYI